LSGVPADKPATSSKVSTFGFSGGGFRGVFISRLGGAL
jgi:hypothetical protein